MSNARRQGRFDLAYEASRRWRTRSAERGAICLFSTGATSSSNGTTATKMNRARQLADEIGVDRLC